MFQGQWPIDFYALALVPKFAPRPENPRQFCIYICGFNITILVALLIGVFGGLLERGRIGMRRGQVLATKHGLGGGKFD